MNEYRSVLERAGSNFAPLDLELESLLRRRDRKRRNQRIAAGVVGIAVFVAAIWIVTSVSSLDRSQTTVVPGGDVTGPATETGPTMTGPMETGPTVAPDSGWFDGGEPENDLPPEKAVPSTPEEGELVAKYRGFQGTGSRFVYVYADGRVISWTWFGDFLSATLSERRLTPEGVELVRSGAVQPEDFISPTSDVPADAWEDPEIKPFVPSRYSFCFWTDSGSTRYDVAGYEDPSRVVGFFPAPARAILREVTHGEAGRSETPNSLECSEVVTTDEARTLLDILGSMTTTGYATPHVRVEDSEGDVINWEIEMVLPHGAQAPCTACY